MFFPVLKIIVLSTNLFSLQVFVNFVCKILQIYTEKVSMSILPAKKTSITLLKSPHVYKKSKEQYLLKKYRVVILGPASSFNKNVLKFLLLNKPKSIVLKFVLER